MRFLYILLLSATLLFQTHCKFGARPPADKILAKVFNKTLYLSNLDGMFPENATRDDSASVVNSFSDRWIRDQVLMNEAEKHVPSDLNIDELIKKYRESLILSSYQENLIKQNLDTTIAERAYKKIPRIAHFEQLSRKFNQTKLRHYHCRKRTNRILRSQ